MQKEYIMETKKENVKRNCIICNTEFETKDKRVKMCSLECKEKYKKQYSDKARQKKLSGIDGIDYIICKWCGQRVTRIYGQHLKFSHPGKTTYDYKREFPGAPLYTQKDIKSVTKNSGKHMKQEKYKKMFSERLKGENNPIHKSNMDEQSRKELSPFSKEFYKKRNLYEKDRQEFIKVALKDREFDTRIEYWLKRGFSKDEAKQKIKDRQTTFSKEICIQKYGEKEGIKRWNERQKKWKDKVFNENTYIGVGASKLSSNIIDFIKLKNYNNDELLFGKNEKFIFDKKFNRVYKYDLTNSSNKRILEINGTFWHCKPGLYESDFIHPVKNISAKQLWGYDDRKKKVAENYGYTILTIWEDDINNNPEGIIQKCIDFIYEKNT